MGTTYYALANPVSSLGVRHDGPHTRLTVRADGKTVGTLIFERDSLEFHRFIRLFEGEDLGKRPRGEEGQQVISEYGDLKYLPLEGV